MPWHVAESSSCPSSQPWAVIKDDDGEVEGCHASKASAEAQAAALYANESSRPQIGRTMMRETRMVPLADVEVRDASGSGPGKFVIRGHAAVFDRLSLNLGGFRERIAPGAFAEVLDANPDVHALWDHDTARVLARTRGGSLELREDPVGLHIWARVADTSYARDLRTLMEEGLIDQASFGFTVGPGDDEWRVVGEGDDEVVERIVHRVHELFDVTVTAQGAYPQTTTEVVRSLRSMATAEVELGHLPERALAKFPGAEPSVATFTVTPPVTASGGIVSWQMPGTKEASEPAPETAELVAQRERQLVELRNLVSGETALAREQSRKFQKRRNTLRSRDR